MKSLNSERGITLIEILVVTSLLGIIATIAIPTFANWMPNLRLRQASRELFLDLQRSKSQAIKASTPIGLTITTVACPGLPNTVPANGGSYTLFTDDGSGGGGVANGVQDGTEVALRTINMPSDVALCATPLFLTNTSFQTTGSPINGGTVTVTNNNGMTANITLSIAGNIRLN